MSKTSVPVVLSADGRRHEPMQGGAVFPVSAIPLSSDKGNLLEAGDDGLLLSGSDIVSATSGNPLKQGADGGILLDVADIIVSGDKVLRKDGAAVGTALDLRYDTATARLTLLGVNNVVVATAQLPVAAGIFTAAEVLTDYTPPSGGAEGTYIHFQFETTDGNIKDLYINVSDLVDTYTNGDGIDIASNVISVKVAQGGPLDFGPGGTLRVVMDRFISADAGNGLKAGADGRLYAAVTADMLGPGLKLENGKIVPDLADGLTLKNGKITIDAAALSEMIAVGVSADADNILMVGNDGKPFLPGDQGSL